MSGTIEATARKRIGESDGTTACHGRARSYQHPTPNFIKWSRQNFWHDYGDQTLFSGHDRVVSAGL